MKLIIFRKTERDIAPLYRIHVGSAKLTVEKWSGVLKTTMDSDKMYRKNRNLGTKRTALLEERR